MSLTLRVIAHSGMRRYPLLRFRSPQSQSDFARSAPGAVELAARRYLDGPCAVDAFVSVEGVTRVIRINQGHEVAVGVARVFDRLAAMEIVVDGVLAASSVLALQQRRTSWIDKKYTRREKVTLVFVASRIVLGESGDRRRSLTDNRRRGKRAAGARGRAPLLNLDEPVWKIRVDIRSVAERARFSARIAARVESHVRKLVERHGVHVTARTGVARVRPRTVGDRELARPPLAFHHARASEHGSGGGGGERRPRAVSRDPGGASKEDPGGREEQSCNSRRHDAVHVLPEQNKNKSNDLCTRPSLSS